MTMTCHLAAPEVNSSKQIEQDPAPSPLGSNSKIVLSSPQTEKVIGAKGRKKENSYMMLHVKT